MTENSRRKSCIVNVGVEVIFDGSKTYWKARATLEIMVVHHTKQSCLEIIIYHPDKGIEAPRHYVSAAMLLQRINKQELEDKIAEKKETLIRSKKVVNAAQVTKEVTEQVLVNFILSRLLLHSGEEFSMQLTPQTGDATVDGRLEAEYEHKPADVQPAVATFCKKVTNTDILSALNQYQNAAEELRWATQLAELSTSSVDRFKLMMAERMRWRSLSPARLRWIKAINRILTQNYVARVRIRLERMYTNSASHEQKLSTVSQDEDTKAATTKVQRPRILRKSIDNSLFPAPVVVTERHSHSNSQRSQSMLPLIPSPTNRILKASSLDSHHGDNLPVLVLPAAAHGHGHGHASPSRRKSQRYNKPVQRRSFQSGEDLATSSISSHAADGASGRIKAVAPMQTSESVPSLIQSYHQMSAKQLAPIAPNVLLDVRERSTKANR